MKLLEISLDQEIGDETVMTLKVVDSYINNICKLLNTKGGFQGEQSWLHHVLGRAATDEQGYVLILPPDKVGPGFYRIPLANVYDAIKNAQIRTAEDAEKLIASWRNFAD